MTDVMKLVGYWDGSVDEKTGQMNLIANVPSHRSELYAPIFAQLPDVRHPDDVAVDTFADAMKSRLKEARLVGRSGWNDASTCSDASLAEALVVNLVSSHPHAYEDIANFAMMLHHRGADVSVFRHAIDILKVYIPKDL